MLENSLEILDLFLSKNRFLLEMLENSIDILNFI
jgi:hypothetical protein